MSGELRPLLAALALFSTTAFAAAAAVPDLPVAHAAVEPASVTVGEPVTLTVTVLAPTWFPRPPQFPNFELPNTITRLPPDSSRPISERIGRATWSGIRRHYQIYPLIAGSFQIDQRPMQVTFADPQARNPITVEVSTPAVSFTAAVPPGAASLTPYLAGRELRLTRQIQSDTGSLQAGDALVVVYQATLDGLPALFLPPLVELPSMPGLSVYAAEPSVTDVDGQAQRTEKITFVYSHGGDYPIPGAQLRWWNLRSGAIETTTAAPLTVFVTGTQHAATGRPDAPLWWRWWWLLPTLLAGVLVARPVLAGFARWRRAQRQRRLASEAHAFSQLTATLRAGDARQAYQQLLTWQAKLAASADLRQFALDWGDEALAAGLTALADTLYAANAQPIPLSSLEAPLRAARARALKGGANRQAPALPVLNP